MFCKFSWFLLDLYGIIYVICVKSYIFIKAIKLMLYEVSSPTNLPKQTYVQITALITYFWIHLSVGVWDKK